MTELILDSDLVSKIKDVNIQCNRVKSSNRIHISSSSFEYFIDYMGNSPVKCYNYKFGVVNDD